jgi:hypothetical protein
MSGIHAGIRPDLALYLRHVSRISRRTYDTFPRFPVALTTRFPDFPSHLRHVSQISRRTYDTFPGFPVALTTRCHRTYDTFTVILRRTYNTFGWLSRRTYDTFSGFPVALTTRFDHIVRPRRRSDVLSDVDHFKSFNAFTSKE